jgi:serine/threonine protein kinase
MTAPENADSSILQTGALIAGTYEITGVISRSQFSVVYAARHVIMGKEVALKVLNLCNSVEDEKRRLRFQQEARLVSRLEHPQIVRTLSAGFLDVGRPYIVMEMMEGRTLREHLQEKGCLSLSEFKAIFSQLLAGLICAHDARIIHRDIKPENILLTGSQDGVLCAKLCDFGIAKVMDEGSGGQSLTSTSELPGSPAYMSPEQCEKKPLDERSDIYSLGCVMYEALSLRAPFVSDSPLEVMYRQINEEPVPVARLKTMPLDFQLLIHKCLQKKTAERWSSARQLLEALSALRTVPGSRLAALLPRLPLFVGLSGLAVLAGLSAFYCLNSFPDKGSKGSQLPAKKTQHRIAQASSSASSEELQQLTFTDIHQCILKCRFQDALKKLDALRDDAEFSDKTTVEKYYAYLYGSLSNYELELKHSRKAWHLALKQDPLIMEGKFDPRYDDPRLHEAACLVHLRDFADAGKILQEQEIRRLNTNTSITVDLYSLKSHYLLLLGRYRESISTCKWLLENVNLNTSQKIHALVDLMKAYAVQNDTKELRKVTKEVLILIPDPSLRPDEQVYLASLAAEAQLLAGDWKTARFIINGARKLKMDCKIEQSVIDAHLLQTEAAVNMASGSLLDAEALLKRAVTIQEARGERQILPGYLNLACIAWKKNDPLSAHAWMDKAMSCCLAEWNWCMIETQSPAAEIFLAGKLKEEGNLMASCRCARQVLLLPQASAEQRRQAELLMKSIQAKSGEKP